MLWQETHLLPFPREFFRFSGFLTLELALPNPPCASPSRARLAFPRAGLLQPLDKKMSSRKSIRFPVNAPSSLMAGLSVLCPLPAVNLASPFFACLFTSSSFLN